MKDGHNCYQSSPLGELLYICSRCGGCYLCDHDSIWSGTDWIWVCKDGSTESIIFDGRVRVLGAT